MFSKTFCLLIAIFFLSSCIAWSQSTIQGTTAPPAPVAPATHNGGDFSDVMNPDPAKVVPKDTILVKGAWSSASDSATPLPETTSVAKNVFTNQYFGITYPLPLDWGQKYTPPPPAPNGSYILAEMTRPDSYKGEAKGTIMFAAHDMFFTQMPATNARQLVNYTKNHLASDYAVEMKPTQTTINGQSFTFFAYWSPVAELHWYVFGTQIRCHTVEIVLMNRDPKTLEELVRDMNTKMKLPAEAGSTAGNGGGNVPVCMKDYATGENVIERVDPVLTQRRYNAIPVRIIIDKEGKIRHMHFLSAFPEQEKAITEALKQWKFKPYERDGKRLEVETGIMFGAAPSKITATAADRATD